MTNAMVSRHCGGPCFPSSYTRNMRFNNFIGWILLKTVQEIVKSLQHIHLYSLTLSTGKDPKFIVVVLKKCLREN